MPIQIKVSNDYVSSGSVFFKSGGAWLKAKEGYVKVEGVWKKFFVSEFKDFFERTLASGLGTSPTGQVWTVARGTWNIETGKAKINTSKSTYPIALIDVGLTDFELQANEMVPGVGVVIRGESSTNWWGLVGWNNQVAYTYSFCPQALVNQGYCIVDNICQQTVCPGGYQSSQSCSQGTCIRYAPDRVEATGCSSVWVPGGESCSYQSQEYQSCSDQCIKTCFRYSCTADRCTGGTTTCTREDGITRCTTSPQICIPGDCSTSTICCDRDTVCTTQTRLVRVCEQVQGSYQTTCTGSVVVKGECLEYGPDVCTTVTSCPGGTSTVNVVCGYPNCAQTGSRQVCPVAEQTATGYNYFYRLYLIKSVNGTLSIEQDFDIGENFTAIKALANGPNLTINVFRSNDYTNQIKVVSYSSFTSPAGSNFGIFAYPSNYQEGNTIGSLEVKQLGA